MFMGQELIFHSN